MNTGFTWLWIIWILLGALIETPALFNKTDGDTLSEHIRKWFYVKDKRPTIFTWFMRCLLMTILIWFITHFFFEWPW